MKISAIIPARAGSKRLKKKNIYPIWRQPMIFWAIKACQESKYDIDVWVSSESDELENKIERKYAEIDNISCGIMYRRGVLYQMGGYNEKMRHREEEELRKRLGQDYKIEHLKIPFYRYRIHNINKTKEPAYETWTV